MGKILDIILAKRLAEWATRSGFLPKRHYGGRKGVGTEDAIYYLDTWTRDRWAEKRAVVALFLDVQSAYPTVHPDRLIHILVGFPLSIREDLTCRINQPLQTDKTAVNLSIVWENLLDFIQSNTEVIAVQMGAKIAPLTPNIVFQNMDLNRQEAVTNTHAIIERATDSDALIFTDGSYEKTKGGGAAALMMNTDESIWFRTGPDIIHSNHECEALGVLAALKLITTNEFAENFNCFTVFTDNRGVLSRKDNPLAEKPGQYIFSEMIKIALNIRPHS